MKNTPVAHLKRNILEILRAQRDTSLRKNDVAKTLRIRVGSDDYRFLVQAFTELELSGEIKKTGGSQYQFASAPDSITGTLNVLKGGGGFIEVDDGDLDEAAVRQSDMLTALHGDRVRAVVFPTGNDPRPFAEVVEVLERRTTTIVGTFDKRGSFFVVIPDNRRFTHDIYIARANAHNAKISEKVVAKLLPWEDPSLNPEGEIIEILGRAGEARVEISSIARRFNLSHDFPPAVASEATQIPAQIPAEEIAKRLDLRNETIFTIDPEDARDFDDAVSLKQLPDKMIELGVHIADVSHYVREDTALDAEAYRRGTSVYLVNGVIPMLPERLSNDLCSLRPDEDRLAYSIIMRLTPRGVVKSYSIEKTIIRSKRRFSYEEAAERIETGKGDFATELQAMNHFAEMLSKKRRREGSIDFETPEVKFLFNDQGVPIEVKPKPRSKSTKLIEDFMLMANQIAAKHVHERARELKTPPPPFMYRIHDVPNPEKLRDLASFVKQFGYTLETENIKPQAIQKLLESVADSPEKLLINSITLRSMAKAVYSEFNIGHFGLSMPYYTHFTSPIRRYPDLMVHRMLHEYAQGLSPQRREHFEELVGDVATHSSQRERSAVEAERDSIKVAQAEYISTHIGETFDGVISGIQPYGIFVELKGNFVEGFLRVRDIEDDYYEYNEKHFSLTGRRHGKVYRLGDPISVRVVRVNKEKHEVDFAITQSEGQGGGGRQHHGSKSHGRHSRADNAPGNKSGTGGNTGGGRKRGRRKRR